MRHISTLCPVIADLNRHLFAVDMAQALEDKEAEFHGEAYSEVWEALQGSATEKNLDIMDDVLQELEWDEVVKLFFHAFQNDSFLRDALQPAIHKKINELAEEKLEKFLDEEE